MSFSAFSECPNDDLDQVDLVELADSKGPIGRKKEEKIVYTWFLFQIEQLLKQDIIHNWPSIRRRPILKEMVYYTREFLMEMNWIDRKFSNEFGEQYFDKNGTLLKPVIAEKVRQTAYFDPDLLNPTKSFMKTLKLGSKNKQGATKIEATNYYHPLRTRSHLYFLPDYKQGQDFTSYMFRVKREHEIMVNGTFAELAKLSYNEHFSNLSNTKIWVGRGILDWHWQKPDEIDVFNYKVGHSFGESLKLLHLASKIPWYLDCYNYIEHIGRFRRFPENAWLMFVNVKDKNGEFYRPYRVINSEAYFQEESYFYAVPKARVKDFFKLKEGDDEYVAIFKKVETEKQDADEVWLSDVVLGWCSLIRIRTEALNVQRLIDLSLDDLSPDKDYLKYLAPHVPDLVDYQTKLKRKTYDDMVKQMCKVDKSRLTRVITLHIVQDYSVFIDGYRNFQWSFSSQLILRWTCYSLNEEDCMYKTFSVVCRYLMKNHPAKWVETERRPEWPIPSRIVTGITEETIKRFEPKLTSIFTVQTTKNRFSADSYPNVKYVYSSARRPLLGQWLQRIAFLVASILLLKNLKLVLASF